MPYPNVQACLGTQIVRSRNPLRRDWWQAIGPARAAFDQAVDTIETILDSTIQRLRTGGFHGEISYELYMIGHKSTSAQPVIMFFSPKEAMPRKEVRRAVDDARRDGRLPKLSGFLTGHKALEPGIGRMQQHATQNNLDNGFPPLVWHTDVFFDPACTIRATAMPIWVKHGVSNWRQATAYTVFKDGECMLMTVSHVFRDNSRDLGDTSSSYDNEYDVGSGTEYEEDETDITSRGSASSRDNEPSVDHLTSISQASDSSASSNQSKSSRGLRRRSEDGPSLSIYPNPGTSPNEQGRALERLGELVQSPPGSIDQDWALVKITRESVISALKEDKSILDRSSVTAFTLREDTRCVVYASRKKIDGQLPGFSTRMLLPESNTFQQLYRLYLEEAIIAGDSGAVVMDASTNQVYGHIVAASETGRIAFVIPASTIYKSAGTVWGPPSTILSAAFAPDQLASGPQALENLDSTASRDLISIIDSPPISIIDSPPQRRRTSESSGNTNPTQTPKSRADPTDTGLPSSKPKSPVNNLNQQTSPPKNSSFRRAASSLKSKVEDVASTLSHEAHTRTIYLKKRAMHLKKKTMRRDGMESPPSSGRSFLLRTFLDVEEIRDKIYGQLLFCQVGEPGKEVILPELVKRIWDKYDEMDTVKTWYDTLCDTSGNMNSYIQIMSILIYIDFDEWPKFRILFVDPRLDDKCIPFRLEDLQGISFRHSSLAVKFYNAQWLFCPCRIREGQEVYPIEEQRRLPWLNKGQTIGNGAFGKVSKRIVAAGYLESRDGAVNPAPRFVAVKTVAKMEYSRRELDSQQVLQRCLGKHSRIMMNFAALLETHTNSNNPIVHHIIYELAAFSLNKFLMMQPSRLSRTSNQAFSLVAAHSKDMWPGDLIAESMNLADALDFLHNRIFTNRSLSIVHNNLTPQNILVVYPDNPDARNRYPVGQWKLADFGFSTIRPKGKLNDRLLSKGMIPDKDGDELGTEGEGIAPADEHTPMREPGRYTPPELGQAARQEWDGISADLWSFGCVFSEILSYAIRLDPGKVEDLRHAILGPDHRFYDPMSLDVKSEFHFYLDGLPKLWRGGDKMAAPWVSSCVELINAIVVADPQKRLRAQFIRDALSVIHDSMTVDKEWWLETHGVTQETAAEGNDAKRASTKKLAAKRHVGYDLFGM